MESNKKRTAGEELSKIFKRYSDCYADTWHSVNGVMEDGDVIQAITEQRFIEAVNLVLSASQFKAAAATQGQETYVWVKASERLPPTMVDVILKDKDGYVYTDSADAWDERITDYEWLSPAPPVHQEQGGGADIEKLCRKAFIDADTLYKGVNVNDWWPEFKMQNIG